MGPRRLVVTIGVLAALLIAAAPAPAQDQAEEMMSDTPIVLFESGIRSTLNDAFRSDATYACLYGAIQPEMTDPQGHKRTAGIIKFVTPQHDAITQESCSSPGTIGLVRFLRTEAQPDSMEVAFLKVWAVLSLSTRPDLVTVAVQTGVRRALEMETGAIVEKPVVPAYAFRLTDWGMCYFEKQCKIEVETKPMPIGGQSSSG